MLDPDPFIKNHVSRSTVWNVIVCPSGELPKVEYYQKTLKLSCWPLAVTLYKAF